MTESEFQEIEFLFIEKKKLETLSTQLERTNYAHVCPADSRDGIQVTGDVLRALKSAVSMRLECIKHKIELL